HAATIGDFLSAFADQAGVAPPGSIDQLIMELCEAHPLSAPTWLITLDALDEAASDADRSRIAEGLAELAVLPSVRVAVATRALVAGNRFGPGSLFAALGVTGPSSRNFVDLDTGGYFELSDLCHFAAALLAQEGADHPGPPGASWETYRANRRMCTQLSTVIAGRAGRNFLVAAMAASQLSVAATVMDPAVAGFAPSAIPAGVGEALEKYLGQLSARQQARERGLLTAFAYGRGAGLDDVCWLAFAAALGYPAAVEDLDIMR